MGSILTPKDPVALAAKEAEALRVLDDHHKRS
jgi:hypothetical protein